MVKAETIIALSERLKQQLRRAKKGGHDAEAFDLRLSIAYLRVFAATIIDGEAEQERNSARKAKLEKEAYDLCHDEVRS